MRTSLGGGGGAAPGTFSKTRAEMSQTLCSDNLLLGLDLDSVVPQRALVERGETPTDEGKCLRENSVRLAGKWVSDAVDDTGVGADLESIRWSKSNVAAPTTPEPSPSMTDVGMRLRVELARPMPGGALAPSSNNLALRAADCKMRHLPLPTLFRGDSTTSSPGFYPSASLASRPVLPIRY